MTARSKQELIMKSSAKEHYNIILNHQIPKKIRPIIVFPFVYPRDTSHLRRLYAWIRDLMRTDAGLRFDKPITVVNRQTFYRAQIRQIVAKDMEEVLNQLIKGQSEVLHTWAVDTCQMWLAGLGYAYDKSNVNDVFWIIPGDFHYATDAGKKALDRMLGVPDKVYSGECELCLGQITVPLNSSKQQNAKTRKSIIDTGNTFLRGRATILRRST